MMNTKTNQKGITLVALVVTIIVLIILAGVSISLVLGENGIVQKAKEGRNNYAESARIENEQLANVDAFSMSIGDSEGGGTPPAPIYKYDSDITDDSSVNNEEIELAINFNENQKIVENANLTLTASTTKNIKKIQLFLDNVEILTIEPTIRKIYSKSNIGINDFTNLDQVQKFDDCTMKIIVTNEENNTKEKSYTVKNYTVGNATCLNSLASTVNGGTKLTGETIIQLKDITTTSNYVPIGYLTSYSSATSWSGPVFEGIYDGKGHTITVSGYSLPSNLNRGVGIFGNIQNATIKNLTANANSTLSITKYSVGGICGSSFTSNFINCHNNISINNAQDTVGGIVGCAELGTSISKCSNTASIASNSNCVGGICGWLEGSLEESYNSGNISRKR